MPSRARSLAALVSVVAALGLLSGVRGLAQSETPDLQLKQGQTFYSDGRFGEALLAFSRASSAEAAGIRIPARIGVLQSALRVAEFDLARMTALALREERPGDADIVALFGDAMWSAGLFADADRAYGEALGLKPDLARAHNGLARTLCAKSRFDEALDHALTAVRLAPAEGDFSYTLGTTYQRMGRYPDASAAYERFVALLPKREKDDRAVWADSMIRSLKAYGKTIPNEIIGDRDAVHVLPFRIANEKIVVSGRINGGPLIEFIVDTGAELATVSRRTAMEQRVAPVAFTVSAGVGEVRLRGLQLGRFDELEFGDLKMRNVPCIIKTPALVDLPTPERESMSPLALGFSVAVDYRRRQITLARRLPTDDSRADETMPLWLTRLATVKGTVGEDRERSFVVDTGGQVISISTDAAKALRRPPGLSRIGLKVYGASGWDRDAYLLPGVTLAFNDIRFEKLSVVVLNLRAPSVLLGYDVGGIVGHQFLSRYHVSFDLEKAELRLRKPL